MVPPSKDTHFTNPLRLEFYSLLGNHILAFAAEYLPYPSKALSLLLATTTRDDMTTILYAQPANNMSIDFKTDSRPIMTYTSPYEHANIYRANPSYDAINWAYPTQYRPRGPNQSVPSAAHTPSTSISSTTTSHCTGHRRSKSEMSTTLGKGVEDVIARILETDSIPQGTYLASQRVKKCSNRQEKKYPERTDSRRALLSMANGIKAPLLLRGASHSNRSARVKAPVPLSPVPKRTSEVLYLHKELPPTPPLANSPKSAHSPHAASSSQYAAVIPERKAALPMTRPLNLNINTLAAKRLSRAMGKSNGRSFALSRFKAVPAPIRPPRFRGPSASNGPSSASTTDEFTEDAKIEELQLGEPLIQPRVHQEQEKPKFVMTPMGELPITPLDIPVDWDDLHDRWTSPIAVHPAPEKTGSGQTFVFDAFRQDIDELFARSPTIGVRGSVELAGWSAEGQEHSAGQPRHSLDAHPFSCAVDLSEDSEGEKKEKRHGKVLVKEELKLCLDLNIHFGEKKMRRQSGKHRGPMAGESFLMMTSPLSPETASLRASIIC